MSILDQRASGVLMHISSLPGNTGIGTLGKYAYQFVDYLKKYGQTYWQMLPICPTSYGDSPYQSFSTFAGNPYFIDFEKLESEGLLSHDDWAKVNWGDNKNYVDYGLLYVERHKVFAKIQENFNKNIPADFEKYCSDNSFWLDDYALFMAIKDAHNGASFSTWESDIKVRQPGAVVNWSERCAKRIQYYKILQYLFYKQWYELKKYANDNGIKIIGDIPIYVAADSSDVWTNPKQFDLKGDLTPVEVAGCPPDAFSADGQLWGNPVYNWEYQKQTGYAWWKKRISECLKIYDVIRIDHFRGFDEYYCIPFGSPNAKVGQWRKGPGAALFNEIKKEFGDINIIAEDLGYLTDTVIQMLKDVGFPGMKVLQFAFDSREESDYIPHRYGHNSVVYTGTHDNDTILGWCKSAGADDVAFAKKYLRANSDDELRQEMMISALSCVANTCILCMQDLIGLDGSARMNIPSTVGNNWKWRASEEQITDKQFEFLGYYSKLYGRADR
ncbi:MAG: 4-alpha-glucanotransferase [Treponema sp.]|nr:4-alpha-glucanotransferase [Treponema sp.]